MSEASAPLPGSSPLPVELQDLHVRAGTTVLLESTTATLPAGAISVIVGGSGAGKSVLLRILSGLIPRTGTPIHWEGEVGHPGGAPLGRVGIVFQQFALFDELSPTANVRFAIDHRRDASRPPHQSAQAWLEELGVPRGTHVANLSGGQRQRLAIARTLAGDPDVLLYDEPTSGLDAASGRQVAALIRETQSTHKKTSVVVTHDYETLLPIADHVFLLDSEERRLVEVPREEWSAIPDRMRPVRREESAPQRPSALTAPLRQGRGFLESSGAALLAGLRLPLDLLPLWRQPRWGLRFLLHYLRLVAGGSAIVYLGLAGMLVGFTTTYFTFRFLPQEVYTKPLLIEDLLSAIGFALYRVLVPVLAAILIAARCGAAVAADVGVKRYGAQVEALRTLGVGARTYLLTPILLAFLIGAPLLLAVSYQAARWTSMLAFVATHPEQGPHFWSVHYQMELHVPGSLWADGTGWLLLKTLAGGLGVAAIAYYRGLRYKRSASDVSQGITSTVLWATLFVLLVHFLVAFLEY